MILSMPIGMTVLALLTAGTPHPNMSKDPAFQKVAVTCFSRGEQTSGMNKICYYDCLGSAAAITVSATTLCPITIQQ